jgi:hypothetical protein
LREDIRKAIRQPLELAIRVVLSLTSLAEPAYRQVISERAIRVAVNRFVRDVEPPIVRQPFKLTPSSEPGKGLCYLVVVL